MIKVKNYDEMSALAASMIGAQVLLKPESVLGLATGSSPIGTYKTLVEGCEKGILDFSRVQTVNLDEYCGLSGENPNSYRYFMNDNLFDHVNIDKANEPTDHFPTAVHTVALTESTINANARLFERREDVPTQAITMGIGTIMKADKILLIAGADKKAIVEKAFYGPVTPEVPASVLQLHKNVTVILSEN